MINILLVEDNPDQALLAQRGLSRYNPSYRISVAESGQACLSALAQDDYALILLDYRLPRATGLDVLGRIRQAGHTAPVIIMTAHGDEQVAVEAMKAGAADYVVKQPGYLSQLAPIVDQALRRHSLETDLAASQQRYRLLFEFSRESILILDDQARIVDLNPSAEALLGAPRDQLIGERFLNWLEPEQPDQLTTWYEQLRTRKTVADLTVGLLARAEQKRWVEISANRLEQTGGEHYQILLRDVTQLRRDQDVWNALDRAALAAHGELDPMAIYRAVAHVLLELGLLSSLWWLDEERQALQIRHTTYAQDVQDLFASKTNLDVDDLWVPVDRLPVFYDHVMRGETIYIEDGGALVRQIIGSDDPELLEWVIENFKARAAIILPLVLLGKVAGILLIHGGLSQRDVPAVKAFAAQISSALEHARLYHDAQHRIAELAALQEISFKLGSTLEIEPLLQAITQVALQLTQANNCHIYLVETDEFKFGAARNRDGSREPAVSHPRREGLVARVAQQASSLFIDNARTHPLYQSAQAKEWGVQAIAGCPLLRSGRVLGVFTLTYLEPHSFDQAERHILNLLADQAAVAVETAQLYQNLRQHNEDLSTLYQLALTVSAQSSISDVLGTAYQAIYQITGADSFVVGLYDETADELVFEFIREKGEPASYPNLSVRDSQGLTAWVARNRQELVINDMETEPLPAPGITVGTPVRSWMGIPLITGEQLVGVMAIQSFQPNIFDRGHRYFCRSIAAQVAIALEKARLIQETQQRNWELSVLNKVSAAVSHSLDRETLLDGALGIVLDEMQMDAGAFHLLDDEGKTLSLVCQRNFPPEAVSVTLKISVGEGICGEVASTGQPILLDNYNQDPRRLSQALDAFPCLVTIPLTSKDTVVGTFSLLASSARQITKRESDLLMAIGQQIGIAAENTTLYQKTMDRERRLTRLYEATHSLSSVLEARQIFQRVLETVVSELPIIGALLWLPDSETGLRPRLALGGLTQTDTPSPETVAEIEQVLKGNQGVMWSHKQQPQRWVGASYNGKRGYRIAVPLRGQASEIGVLEVVTAAQEDWLAAEDVEFLTTLSDIASIAHENAQLYDALAQYAVSLEAKVQERTVEVQREKEQTEAILRSVADPIFVLDVDSNIVLTNPAGEAFLADPHLHELLQTVAQQPSTDAPGPTITLDKRDFQARAAKLYQEQKELGAVLVLRDVTHFEEVNRLKSQFVSTVSHELRTPLSNIKLYHSLLERGHEEKRERYQSVMGREINRLENLIEDLLDLSRLESRERSVTKERLDLKDVTSHVHTVLTPQADVKHIEFSTSPQASAEQFIVQANREQMIQMIINLTANAINYTEPGGSVALSLDHQTDANGQWIVLTVQDTGVGIPADDLSRIFDRFFRGQIQQHMSSGTGLGLAIVNEILEHHNGWITVKSKVGVGSLFTVGLPATTAEGEN